MSRNDTPEEARQEYHLIIDEFSFFSTVNGLVLANILSQARKFGVYLTLSHQTWNQLPKSVQNMAVELFFGLGYDATVVAPRVSTFDPLTVKHEVENPQQAERIHPLFFSLLETHEEWIQDLERLKPQEAYVKARQMKRLFPWYLRPFLHPPKSLKIETMTIPPQTCSDQQLEAVQEIYARRLLRGKRDIEQERAEGERIVTMQKLSRREAIVTDINRSLQEIQRMMQRGAVN